MATYLELHELSRDTKLATRIVVAGMLAVHKVLLESKESGKLQRQAWASGVLQDPQGNGSQVLWAILSKCADMTKAQVENLTDDEISAYINEIITKQLVNLG